MLSFIPSLLILGIIAAIALALAVKNSSLLANRERCRAAARVLLYVTGAQCVHFAEEAYTGFADRFPALFGLEPIPGSIFIGFNLAWIMIWLISVLGLLVANRVALFASWFLALAGAANGLAHPLLSTLTGGYFPGLVTSPLIGFGGIWLWNHLRSPTGSQLPQQ